MQPIAIMKYIATIAKISTLGILVLILFYALNNILISEESREIEPFHGIKISGLVDVVLAEGPTESVKVVADDRYINAIKTEVVDNILTVYTEGKIRLERRMDVYITYTKLDTLIVGGASTLLTTKSVVEPRLYINSNQAAELKVKFQGDTLQLKMDQNANVQLAGFADHLGLEITGFGDLMAYNMPVKTCQVLINGPKQSQGVARVHVTESLSGLVKGSRLLKYMGEAENTVVVEENGKIEKY